MHIDAFFLIGGGGHAKVVLDALLCGGALQKEILICDDNPALAGTCLLGHLIFVPAIPERLEYFHIAIGNNRTRGELSAAARLAGGLPVTVAHPRASIGSGATIAEGCFVAANATIAPEAALGEGVIVNHGAVIDHDCRVGAFTHIGPNATIGGGVRIGEGVLIGAGATVLPGLIIGDYATIGAGAVVHREVPAGETRAGVPARTIQ